MKLRKQVRAKAVILAAAAGLLLAFYAAIKSEPRIGAAEQGAAQPPVDYNRFFSPGASPSGLQPIAPVNPQIRTRSS